MEQNRHQNSVPRQQNARKQERTSPAAQVAERRRTEKKRRDSRAAQLVQKRKEERKENAKLQKIREKQKRKAKKRTGVRVSKEAWRNMLIMVAVIIAIVLSMIIFFRVGNTDEHIIVNGESYYTNAEVAQASGIGKGDNLLTLSRAKVAGSVMAKLPYVKTVQITRRLPDTVVITITEYDLTFAIQDETEEWYLISSEGKVLQPATENEWQNHIRLENIQIKTPKIGALATVAGEDSLTANGQFSAMTQLLSQIEKSEIVKMVTIVSIPTSYEISLQYGTQYLVKLGNAENLEYKIEYLRQVIEKLESYQTGTIDLSFSEGSEARFIPNN